MTKEGPDAIGSIFDFFVQNRDSIFTYESDYSLDLINGEGQIIDRNLIPYVGGFSDSQGRKIGLLSHPFLFKLHYDSQLATVFFHSYSMEAIPNQSEYYTIPILTEVNLETGLAKNYPFNFTDSYRMEGEYLGEYMNPNIVIEDSLIIFSFPISPVINVFDRNSGNLVSREIKSRFTKNTVNSLPSETYSEIHLRLNHLIENPYFYPTKFDPNRKLFYRIHRGEHPNPDLNKGNYNFSYTKDYLTVLDDKLNLLTEIELPEHKYDATSFFVTKEGVYLPFSHYMNEDMSEEKLVFHLYKFEVE